MSSILPQKCRPNAQPGLHERLHRPMQIKSLCATTAVGRSGNFRNFVRRRFARHIAILALDNPFRLGNIPASAARFRLPFGRRATLLVESPASTMQPIFRCPSSSKCRVARHPPLCSSATMQAYPAKTNPAPAPPPRCPALRQRLDRLQIRRHWQENYGHPPALERNTCA